MGGGGGETISGGGVGDVPESQVVGLTEEPASLGAGVTVLDLMMLSTTFGFFGCSSFAAAAAAALASKWRNLSFVARRLCSTGSLGLSPSLYFFTSQTLPPAMTK